MSPVKRLLLPASCALLLTTGHAETPYSEEVLVTASREGGAAHNALSMHSLDAEQLRELGHQHISEATAAIPGVMIQRGNGQEQLQSIRSAVLTGPGSCGAFYVAEDGIPVRAPGFCNVNQLFDINTEQAARLTVIAGPGSAVHGANALHGVIDVRSDHSSPGYVAVEAGSNDYQRLKARWHQQSGQQSLSVYGHSSHDNGYKDEAGYHQQKLNILHRYEGEQWLIDSGLALQNLNQETAGFLRQGEGAYKDDSLKRVNENPEAYRDTRSARAYSRITREFKNNASVQLTPYLRYTRMDFLQHFLPGTPLEQNGQQSIGLQSQFNHQTATGTNLSHGIDIDYTEGWLEQSQEGGFGPFPPGQQYDYQVDALNIAAWLSARQTIGEQGELQWGARLEQQRYDYDNRMLDGNTRADGSSCPGAGCRYSRPADRDDSFDQLAWYTGYRHQLSDSSSAWLRLAAGHRPPQATELYRLQQQQNRADLDSEQSQSVELGIEKRSEHTAFRATLWIMRKKDVIIQNDAREYLNGSETGHRGLELLISHAFNENLRLQGNVALSKHQYRKDQGSLRLDGNDIDTAPRKTASASLAWDINDQLTATLFWQHIGAYYLDPANEHRYPGHDLLNLRLDLWLSEQLSAHFRIRNLLDSDYAERADFVDFNGVVDPADFRYFVGEPRSATAELRFQF